jgi:hypothetical protein
MSTRHLLYALSLITLLAVPNIAFANSENPNHDNAWNGGNQRYGDRYDHDQKRDDRSGRQKQRGTRDDQSTDHHDSRRNQDEHH